MSAKKIKKTTAAKKTAKKEITKKISAKKVSNKKMPIKKTAIKTKKNTTKKTTAPKISEKKALLKKSQPKKTPAKKTPAKKILTKKVLVKKVPAKQAPIKKSAKHKKEIKSLNKISKKTKSDNSVFKQNNSTTRKALAKSILARTGEKKAEEPKVLEKKNESLQRTIIFRKSEGHGKTTFKADDYAVYPSHGIGKIVNIEKTLVLGQDFSCYLMYFEKEKLTIKIPINSAEKIGLRHLISKSQMDEVFAILRSGVKKLKGMWSRRAQEYETKINSGDIMLLAEVLRDLTRDIEDGERSYSERIIYETAIYRLASEYAAIYDTPFEEAKDKVTMTAKDKLNSEGKVIQRDEFDEFDIGDKESDDEDEESEDEEDEDDEEDDEDDDYDDDDEDDDDKPRKKRKKK